MNDKPTRKYNRLKNFDYSSVGDYYITICTKNKQNFFWVDNFKTNHADCKNYTSLLNPLGQTAYSVIKRTDIIYNGNATVDKFVIMPNHVHMIISIHYNKHDDEPAISIPQIVKQIKRCISVQSNTKNIWQKNYYDHIIRNEKDYDEIWEYIDANPRKLTGSIFMQA